MTKRKNLIYYGILAAVIVAGFAPMVFARISNPAGSSLSTPVTVANGGTGVATFGGTNHVLYTTAADTLSSEAAFTYNASTDRFTVVSASTTNLTVATLFRITPSGSVSSVVAGDVGIDTTSGQIQYSDVNGTTRVLVPYVNPVLNYSTSSPWTGTTTRSVGTAPASETWNWAECFTNIGTVNFVIGDYSASSTSMTASTTAGRFVLNKSFTAGQKKYIDIGSPASSPREISCTFNRTYAAD